MLGGVTIGVDEEVGTPVEAVVVGVVDGCPCGVGVPMVVVARVVGVGVDGGRVEGEVVGVPEVVLPGVVATGFVSVGGEGVLVVFTVVGEVVRGVVDSVVEGEVD